MEHLNIKLDHIGIVVKNLEHSKEYYKKTYGFNPLSDIIHEPIQKVNLIFIETGHGHMPVIELITPSEVSSPVTNFLEKKGGGLHHLAYEVSDIEQAIEHFKQSGSLMVSKIVPGTGHKGRRTIWLYTAEKSLVELIEAKK